METVLDKARVIALVFHGDLDGIIGAALAARWAKSKGKRTAPFHSTVRGLRRVLRDAVNTLRSMMARGAIALFDLAVQSLGDAIVYAQQLRGVPAAWFDHHPWPEGAEEKLREAGVEVHHRRDRVTAELVAEALGLRDELSMRLVELAKADDTCDPRETLADKWRIVLRYVEPLKVYEAFVSGDLWPEWAEKIYAEKVGEYLARVEKVAERLRVYEHDGVRVAVVEMEPDVDVCSVQKLLWRRGWKSDEVDVELYIYPRAVSIRSSRVDAGCIARKLGGGGHSRAAGAPKRYSYGAAGLARQVAVYARECMESDNTR